MDVKCEPEGSNCIRLLENYSCSNCNFGTTLQVDLFCHLKAKKDFKVRCYTCSKCKFRTFSLLCWFKHNYDYCPFVKEHTRRKLAMQCPHCSFKAKQQAHVERHIIAKHTNPEDIQWFKCKLCDYKGKIKYALNLHMKLKHTTDNEAECFNCGMCDYKSKSKRNVKRHTFTNHTAPEKIVWFKCSYCEHRTRFLNKLDNHIVVKHRSPQPVQKWHKCTMCGYKSKVEVYLFRHYKTVHGAYVLESHQ
ncbi:RE1-silencing transcription factor-like [Tribolium madens]|uniref:RE1-silencing transcription factor-like n=1 Tax=Tribolium madens TaxID=41895 RepID=UPI001CF72646|nr:RE1-silencing transcription factor-like [Tribolium madens]